MKSELSNKLFETYSSIHKVSYGLKGIDLSNYSSSTQIMLKYFNIQKKMVTVKPRDVYQSNELICPTHLVERFEEIKKGLRDGEDINGYLSLTAYKPNKNDHLLYEWGVHHLHFDCSKQPSFSRKDRSPELLFVFFRNNAVYLLAIQDHSSFYNTELLEILDSNWPSLIEDSCIGSNAESFCDVPTETRRDSRKAGINTAVILKNGKVLMPLPMEDGITSSGDSVYASHKVVEIQHYFDKVANFIIQILSGEITDEYIYFKDEPSLMICTQGYLYIAENTSEAIPIPLEVIDSAIVYHREKSRQKEISNSMTNISIEFGLGNT